MILVDLSLLDDEYVTHLVSLGWVVSRALFSRPESDGPCLLEVGLARNRVMTDTSINFALVSFFHLVFPNIYMIIMFFLSSFVFSVARS